METDILLITPPFTQLNTPYPATAYLKGFLNTKQIDNQKKGLTVIFNIYFQNISTSNIVLPQCIDFNQHVFHLFVIRSKKRDELKKYLYKNRVETLVHYPIAIHKQLAYKEFNDCVLPINEQIQKELAHADYPGVFIDASISQAANRVGFNKDRPLLLINPRQQWLNLMSARRPIYEKLSSEIISSDNRKPAEVATIISEKLKSKL